MITQEARIDKKKKEFKKLYFNNSPMILPWEEETLDTMIELENIWNKNQRRFNGSTDPPAFSFDLTLEQYPDFQVLSKQKKIAVETLEYDFYHTFLPEQFNTFMHELIEEYDGWMGENPKFIRNSKFIIPIYFGYRNLDEYFHELAILYDGMKNPRVPLTEVYALKSLFDIPGLMEFGITEIPKWASVGKSDAEDLIDAFQYSIFKFQNAFRDLTIIEEEITGLRNTLADTYLKEIRNNHDKNRV